MMLTSLNYSLTLSCLHLAGGLWPGLSSITSPFTSSGVGMLYIWPSLTVQCREQHGEAGDSSRGK